MMEDAGNVYLKGDESPSEISLTHKRATNHSTVFADGCITVTPGVKNGKCALIFYQDTHEITDELMVLSEETGHYVSKPGGAIGIQSYREDVVTVTMAFHVLKRLRDAIDARIKLIEGLPDEEAESSDAGSK